MKIRIISFALFISMIALLTGCSGSSDGGTIKVGMECAYAPFNWTQMDDSNNAVPIEGGGYANGYDVQIAKRVADGLGLELVIVKTEWDGLVPALSSGKIDAIFAGMSPTPERKESIDFSDNYYVSDLVVVVDKNGPYVGAKSINDFAGAKITAQLSTFHYTVIDQMLGVVKETAMETFPTMIAALASGKIDGYISERPGAISAAITNPKLGFVGFESGSGFSYSEDEVSIAVGLKKESPLKEGINAELAKIPQEERASIMEEAVKNQPASEE